MNSANPNTGPAGIKSSLRAPTETLAKWVDFKVMGNQQGWLVALESNRQAPFSIARVYYIYGTQPGVSRGFHAHKALDQLCVAVAGSCRMLLDDGLKRTEVRLDRPDRGLLIGPMLWHEMHDFSHDCVLMVLANAPYDECDYIRDYNEFQSRMRR